MDTPGTTSAATDSTSASSKSGGDNRFIAAGVKRLEIASTEASTESPPCSSSPSRSCSRRTSPRLLDGANEHLDVRDACILRALVEFDGVDTDHAPLLFPLLFQRLCGLEASDILAIRHSAPESADCQQFEVAAAVVQAPRTLPQHGEQVMMGAPVQGRVVWGAQGPAEAPALPGATALQVAVPPSWVEKCGDPLKAALVPLEFDWGTTWTRTLTSTFGKLAERLHVARHCPRGPHVLFAFADEEAAKRCADAIQDRVLSLSKSTDVVLADVVVGKWADFVSSAEAGFAEACERQDAAVAAARETLVEDVQRAVAHMDMPGWGIGLAHLLCHWVTSNLVNATDTLVGLASALEDDPRAPSDQDGRRSYLISQLLYMLLSRVAKDRDIDAVHMLRLWEHRGWVKFTEPVRADALVVGQLRLAVESASEELASMAEAAEARSREAEEALVRELEAEAQMQSSLDRKKKKAKRKSKEDPSGAVREPGETLQQATSSVLSSIYRSADAEIEVTTASATETTDATETAEEEDVATVAGALLAGVYQRSVALAQSRSRSAKRSAKEKRKKSKEVVNAISSPVPVLQSPALSSSVQLKRPFEAAVDKSDALHRRSSDPEFLLPEAAWRAAPAAPALLSEPPIGVDPLARHNRTGGLLPTPGSHAPKALLDPPVATRAKTETHGKGGNLPLVFPVMPERPPISESETSCASTFEESSEPLEERIDGFDSRVFRMDQMSIEMVMSFPGVSPEEARFECIGMSGIEEEDEEVFEAEADLRMLLDEEPERPHHLAAGLMPLGAGRQPRRSRGGKGRKGPTAGSPASSYSGMAFSYAVSASPPAANAPPATPTARRASGLGLSPTSSGIEATSTQGSFVSPASATFSPADRFAQNASFESYGSAQSPPDFQPESRSSFTSEGRFGAPLGLESLSPTNTAPTTYLQKHQDCYSPSEMYSHHSRSPLQVYAPSSPQHVGALQSACTSPAAPSCTSPIFTEVVKLMAHGNLEHQLREHENVPYED